MQLDRRTFLASSSALATATIAGCSEINIAGDEPLAFESTPADVSKDALEGTGYEEATVDDVKFERTFDVADEERTVTVTNWQSIYEKELDLDIDVEVSGDLSGAVFTVLTTPKVEIIGREFNPVAEMSNEELVDRIQDRYDGGQNVEVDEEDTATVLGEETTRTRFVAEADPDTTEVDVYLHVSDPVESGDDLVICGGGHPRMQPEGTENVVTMMEAIEHGE